MRLGKKQVLQQADQKSSRDRNPALAPGIEAQEGYKRSRYDFACHDRENDARLNPLNTGEIWMVTDVINQVRNIEKYSSADIRGRPQAGSVPSDVGQ